MQDFIIHLHLYFSNEEAEKTALQNIKNLKNNGFKILVTSPQIISTDFYSHIDYFVFDRENQILRKDYTGIDPIIWWNDIGTMTFNFVIDGFQKHALAVLRSMIKGAAIAKALDFKYIIRFEYDDIFGPKSIEKIYSVCEYIKNNDISFYLYKNEYDELRKNISTHLMFYKPKKFLNVFESIKNEDDYCYYLEKINLPNKSIILEEFMYRVLDEFGINAHYAEGSTMQLEYPDTLFNMHQVALGVVDGILSDLMRIRNGFYREKNRLCIIAKNVESKEPILAHFDFYNHEDQLEYTKTIELNYVEEWKLDYVYNLENIKLVKIRHNNNLPHKSFSVYFEGEFINIIDNSIKSTTIPELVFN